MPIDIIDAKLCTGCGICINSCMMDVIRMDPVKKKVVIKYKKDCFACHNCEFDCPTHAITVTYPKGTPGVLPWG